MIAASVDWASALSRTDPTKTVAKFIKMGVRPSIVNILIEFLEDRQMTVNFNGKESSLFPLVGGGPQGSWTGQAAYIVASDDNADCVPEDDQFKYSDDLSILEQSITFWTMWPQILEWTCCTFLPKGSKPKYTLPRLHCGPKTTS